MCQRTSIVDATIRLRYPLLALHALSLAIAPARAEEFASKSAARQFSDSLVQHFMKEQFDQGFGRAKPYWPMPAAEIDGLVKQIKKQWPIVRRRFGVPIGMEFVREETIGKSFLRYYYLHKFDNHAIYWRFDFYRPEAGWKINSILFLDTLDELYR